ncbi:MAG TPA: ATP-grasp domain-containing protein [Pseudonocardiaceae bacterium]
MTADLVLVESNGTYGRELALLAVAGGRRVLLLARDPERYADLAEHGVTVRECDTRRPDLVLAESGSRPAGVLSGYEITLPVAAQVARVLGLPGPDPAAAHDTLTKPRARALTNALVGNDVPFWLVDGPAEVDAVPAGAYPVVAKPSASGGSIGVRVLADADALREHVRRWLHAPDERGRPLVGPLLVERYVPGREYSVELFHGRPLAVVRKSLGGVSGVVETGHVAVPWAAAPERAALEPFVTALVRRLNLGWGPAHLELRLDGDTPRLVEVNLRLAGDRIPELVRHVTGVDLYALTLAATLGEDVAPEPGAGPARAAAIRFLTARAAGTVTAAWGEADAAAVPHVVRSGLMTRVGATVRPAEDSGDRIGFAVAVAGDPDTAVLAAEDAVGKLGVTVDG